MSEELRAVLTRTGLIGVLDGEDIATFERSAVRRRFRRGDVLWRAGTPARGLILLAEGEVRIVRSREGRQHLVHVSRPGATMGEVPLFAGTGYPASAIGSRDGSIVVLVPDAVLAVAARNPRFSAHLLRTVCRRLAGLIDRLEANTLAGVRSRLAASLLGMSAELPAGSIVRFPGSQTEWAENLGTVREALSRELRTLVEAGVLERRGRGAFGILNEVALEEIALDPAATPSRASPGPAARAP